jgi:hypothetical protein
MNKRISTVLAFLLVGVIGLGMGLRNAEAAGEPVIDSFFATKELAPGDTLKVYLKASGKDSALKMIYATVEQPGGGVYPVGLTRVKGGAQKELSGYLHFSTITGVGSPADAVPLKLTLQVQDERGRFSEPVVFSVALRTRAAAEGPPAGAYAETDLGPIMIRLRPIHEGSGNPSYE